MGEWDALAARAAAMASAPLACAFSQSVALYGLSLGAATGPVTSFHLLGDAVNAVTVWRPDHGSAVKRVLAAGPRLRSLTRAMLAQPAAAWWFAPLDRGAQLWASGNGNTRAPRRPAVPHRAPTTWELYAQKPTWGLFTSTAFDGLSSYLVGASDVAGDLGPLQLPVARFRLSAASSARIFEVDGPDAWRRLCVAYPAAASGGLKGGRLVPDFAAVTREWDAVHLSLGGLLIADQVRLDGPEGPTELLGWDCEQTVWLRWVFEDVNRLPDLTSPVPALLP